MKLNVPLIRQEKNSFDCGLAGSLMILKYYKVNKTIAQLKKDLKVHENVGTYSPQLGLYFLKNGFKVEIITMNPHIFSNNFKNKSQADLLTHFKELIKKNKNQKHDSALRYFKEFLENKGKVTVKIPSVEDISQELNAGRPVGALVTSNFLRGKKAGFNFHFNIITGIDSKFIYVNDPLWDHRGGQHKYPVEEFLYALHASTYGDPDNGSLIKIIPPK